MIRAEATDEIAFWARLARWLAVVAQGAARQRREPLWWRDARNLWPLEESENRDGN